VKPDMDGINNLCVEIIEKAWKEQSHR
jgi:hypothetical protein